MTSKFTGQLKRGMVIDVNLDPTVGSETGKIRPCVVITNDIYNGLTPIVQVIPITAWSEKKGRIKTNIVLEATKENGLSKTSIADCLQTRPIDYQKRMTKIRGAISNTQLDEISNALKQIFALK